MVLFVDYLQSRSVGEGAKSIYQRFKKVIRYAIEHDVILKDLTYKNVDYSNKLLKFEQNGEDRAAYGEQLLKKLEKQLNTKGLNERRFREFRRLYLVYPQLKEEVLGYVMSGSEIRHSLTAEFTAPIRQMASAESENAIRRMPSAELPSTHPPFVTNETMPRSPMRSDAHRIARM